MKTARSMKVFVLTIGNGINILINFLTLPYLVRSMSYDDYGSYGQALIVISFLQGFFTFNFNQVSNVFFAKGQHDPKHVFSSLMRTTFLMGLIAAVVMLLLLPVIAGSFNNALLEPVLLCSALNLMAQVPIPVLISILIFHDKVRQSAQVLVITNILKVAVMFLVIHFYHSVELLMAGISLVSVIQLLALYFSVPKSIRSLRVYDSSMVRRFFVMATPLTASSFLERSVVYLDGIMISAILTTTDFALYRAGAFEVPFISSLYGSVASIVMPEVARYFAGNRQSEIVALKRSAITGTAFFVYPVLIFLLLFSAPIVSFYLSDKYAASSVVFAIFNLSLLIRINDYQDVIIVSGNSRFIFRSIVLMLILSLVMNFFLIQYFGIEGAALSFILFLFIYAAILTSKTCSVLKCSFSELFDWKALSKIIGLSFACLTPLILFHHFRNNSIWVILAFAPVYLSTVYILGIRFGWIEMELISKVKERFPWLSMFLTKKNNDGLAA